MAMLDRGLVARGHRSIAIACAGSRAAGALREVRVGESFDEKSRCEALEAFRQRIREALESESVDLVHMHGLDFYQYLPPPGVPVLATLHLPASFYPDSVFRLSRPDTWLNCVSAAQLDTCPNSPNLVAAIENGIPLDLFPAAKYDKGNYALALGRICPEKGFHLAIQAANQARTPLWIAGAVFGYAEHQEYFRRTLMPRLIPPDRFLGAAGFRQKVELLALARCLVISSLVPETSSLVAMEALACGTPVVSFRSGALTGIVKHGSTGFLAHDLSQMAAGITRSGEIDVRECRRDAELRFSAERMTDEYVGLYQRLITTPSRSKIAQTLRTPDS